MGRRGSAVGAVRRTARRASMFGGALSYGGQTEGECRLNYIIITHPDNLSISFYKWFGCCGVAGCLLKLAPRKSEAQPPHA